MLVKSVFAIDYKLKTIVLVQLFKNFIRTFMEISDMFWQASNSRLRAFELT